MPGPAFKHEVEVRTTQGQSAQVRVGEWLDLHGRRSTGAAGGRGAQEPRSDGCWVAPPPAAEEPQVADDLTWTAQPEGKAEFNLGILADHARRVRFSAPGRYVLRASSSTWCSPRVVSNELDGRGDGVRQ